MRNALRLSLLAVVAVAGVTCTDAPTAPRSSLATVLLAPSFTPAAAQAWSSLAAFNVTPNNVRVVLKRPGPPEVILKDTTITLAPGQTEITIELTVPVVGETEQLGASIQVRDGSNVIFEGSSTVQAVRIGGSAGSGGTPTPGGVSIPITYVGPGATIRSLTVTPATSTVAPGATVNFGVEARDASGAVVPDASVAWRVVSGAGTITADGGVFTAGTARGTTTVRAAMISGVSGDAQVTVVPPPSRLVVVSGSGQTAVAGRALAQPFVVEVQANDGLPVAGVQVLFGALTGASITPTVVTTDATGRASATMTLGRTAGVYSFTAAATGLGSVSVSGTATQPPPSAIAIVSGNDQGGAVGTAAAQPLVVRVSDEFGNAVAGTPVSWTIVSGGGTLGAASSVTGTDGTAQVSYTFGGTPGAVSIRASVPVGTGTATVSFALTARSGSAAGLRVVSGSGQSAPPNTLIDPLVVQAVDALGNPVAGAGIAWHTSSGRLTASTTTTGADGQASNTITLGTTAGAVSVVASMANGAITAGFELTVTSGPAAGMTKVAGDAQSATVGSSVAVAPSVRVADASGNPVAGAPVTFAVASGGGSITGGSTTTNASGIATVGSWTLGSGAGSNSLTATSGSLSATFTATGLSTTPTPGAPTQLVALNGPTFSYAAGSSPTPANWPTVKVRDAANLGVPGVPVTVTVYDSAGVTDTAYTVTTDATGSAVLLPPVAFALSEAETHTLVASTTTFTSTPLTFTVTVTPAAFAGIVVQVPPPAYVAVNEVFPVIVTTVDSFGNPTPGVAVTPTVVSGGAIINGTLTVTSDANGVATFTNLRFTTLGGPQVLKFFSGSVFSATTTVTVKEPQPRFSTGTLSVSPTTIQVGGSPANMSVSLLNYTGAAVQGVSVQGYFTQGTSVSRAAGGTSVFCPSVAGELPTTGCSVSFSAQASNTSSGTGTLVAGSATYKLDLQVNGVVVGTTSFGVTLTAAAPVVTQLGFSTYPPSWVGVNTPFSVAVQTLDANGNAFNDGTVRTVSMQLKAMPADTNVGVAVSQPTSGGVATFSSLQAPAEGQYELVATTAGLTGTTSFVFPAYITAPPAGTTRVWTGATNTDWNTASNWSPSGVPTISDHVWLGGSQQLAGRVGAFASSMSPIGAITLSANAVVGEIQAAPGISIDVAGHVLEVAGSVLRLATGDITSSVTGGDVRLTGANPSVDLYGLPALTVQNGATLVDYTHPSIAGSVRVLGGVFTVGNNYLDIGDSLRVEGASAGLAMSDGGISESSGSSVYVYGSYIANGAASGGLLLGGYLYVDGDLRQLDTYSAQSFLPSPNLYVTMEPAAGGAISFASPASSYFQELDAYGYSPPQLVAGRVAARRVPSKVSLRRDAAARRLALAPARVRERRAARQSPAVKRTRASRAMASLNSGVITFETSAKVADLFWVDAPVAIPNSGSAVVAENMYVASGASFTIASGASLHVNTSCGYDIGAPTVPAGVCPNPPPAVVGSLQPAAAGSDVFVGPAASIPANFGVLVLDQQATPQPMAGATVYFSLNDDGGACTLTSSSAVTDASGFAQPALQVNAARGSCVLYAYDSDESHSTELRVYAIPAAGSGAFKLYLGQTAGPGNWTATNNWYDVNSASYGAPAPGDRVFISLAGISRSPLSLGTAASVSKVWLTPGALLQLGTSTLTVTDSITGGGNVYGDAGSGLLLTGTNQVIELTTVQAPLTFGSSGCSTQSFRLGSQLVAANAVQVNCPLDLNGFELLASSSLTTTQNGSLTMGSSSDILFVEGLATFSGAQGNIAQGTMTFLGDLTVNQATSFKPAAGVITNLAGSAVQNVSFPTSANGNAFGVLQVSNSAGVQFSGTGSVASNLYLYGHGTPGLGSKLTLLTGAGLSVATTTDVNQNAVLTVNSGATFNTQTLSVAPGGSVVANGTVTATSCPNVGVTGPGRPGNCPAGP